jgi:hypothetical protein
MRTYHIFVKKVALVVSRVWIVVFVSIFLLALTSQTLIAGPSHPKLNEGLVAWYPFNGNADDESGNGLDATVYAAFLAPDRFNHCEQAYFFDGVNSYMTIDDPTNLLNFDARSNSYTVAVWVNLSSLDQRQEFILDRVSLNNPPVSYDIFYDNVTGKFGADCWDGEVNVVLESLTTPTTNAWYFLTMVDTAGVLKFYINGSQEIAPPLGSNTPNQIPSNYGSTKNNDQGRTIGRFIGPFIAWNAYGFLDDIRIYDRDLSVKEIEQLYHLHGYQRIEQEKFTEHRF